MKQLVHFLLKFGGLAQAGWLLALLGASPVQAQFAAATTYAVGSTPVAVAVGDVNGDGRLDIISANSDAATVSVLLGQAGGFAAGTAYPTAAGVSARVMRLGDVNGDGRLDIVVAGFGKSVVAVLPGQASGGFGAASTYEVGGAVSSTTGVSGLALGDANGDGKLDIVLVNSSSSLVSVLLGQAVGGFAAATTYSPGNNNMPGTIDSPSAVALGDVNGDGRLDLITTNGNNGGALVAIALGQASGNFVFDKFYPTGAVNPGVLALGDVNNDGRLDIVTNGFYDNRDAVLLGQAGGGFAPANTYVTNATNGGGKSNGLALGDVNGDGRLDIVDVTGTPGSLPGQPNTVDVLLGQSGGGFAAASLYASGGLYAYDIALGDVNKDGKLDVLVVNSLSNNVGVLLNQAVFLAAAVPAATPAAPGPYPNPAHGRATVSLATGTTALRLLDALGRELRQQPVAAGATEATLDLQGLPGGLYLVQARGSSGATTAQRLLVE